MTHGHFSFIHDAHVDRAPPTIHTLTDSLSMIVDMIADAEDTARASGLRVIADALARERSIIATMGVRIAKWRQREHEEEETAA